MRASGFSALCAVFAVSWSCAGTETDNPAESDLVSFDSSGCKKDTSLGSENEQAFAEDGKSRQALVIDAGYDGLQCIGWTRTSAGTLQLSLTNFHEGCGVSWQGEARVGSDGVIDLALINSQCAIALCGWCMYDFDFDVASAPSSGDLRVRIGIVDCATQGHIRTDYDVVLAAGADAEGIICRPAHQFALADHAQSTGTCGARNMPCRNAACQLDAASECDTGLTCVEVATGDHRCLQDCSTDADCEAATVQTCQSGSCRIANAW